MTAEFGVFCLVVAMLAACLQFSYFFLRGQRALIAAMMPSAAWLQALCATLALASLVVLRLDSDFSVANVTAHSNLSLPLLYKIAGAWGNHEGSMLLWLLFLTAFGCTLALKPRNDMEMIHPALATQAGLVAATCGFILFTSNPFARLFPPPSDGQALNPVLQDVALSIHPPLLYLGYVGFSLVFSLAVAALINGRAGQDWAKLAHPWIVFSWTALTIGIGLGSWWAYRELGWGGWWFWDPVENASLLPWLSGLALLHSNIALQKRGVLAGWVVLLAIITFALSLIGTFLVRSGALVSVHSFASDPARGMYILTFILVSIGGALLLYARRGGHVQSREAIMPFSREGMMVANNLFLVTACATVLLGTLYPLIMDWLDGLPLAVGAPYFNATFLPLLALPVLLAALAPFMGWQQAFFKQIKPQLAASAWAVATTAFLVIAYAKTDMALALAGFGLAAWLAAGTLLLLITRKSRVLLPVALAHFGVALLVAGITAEGLGKIQSESWLAKGDTISLASYHLTLQDYHPIRANNYSGVEATFNVMYAGKEVAHLTPQYRHYDIKNSTTNEAAIYSNWHGDVYAVIGEVSKDGKRLSVRLYHLPVMYCLWLGFAFMAAGGIVSLIQNKKVSRFVKIKI